MIATKIIATIGPTSESREMIETLIKTGVNVFRFNLKHSTPDWHKEKALLVRDVARALSIPIAILFDLQGAEVRTGLVVGNGIVLNPQNTIRVSPRNEGSDPHITIPHVFAFEHLHEGSTLKIDDGKIIVSLKERKETGDYIGEVLQGGLLESNKSVSITPVIENIPVINDTDRAYLLMAKELSVEFLALSYVKKVQDLEELRAELTSLQYEPWIIAKIETAQAILNFESILSVSDAIMVARGDLGVQLPIEQVPYYQKHIIRRCVAVGKPVITATQMLDSMVRNPFPTRAEISDVANAIYDHTDAVMLSMETAAGKYPLESVETIVKTARFIEEHVKQPKVQFEMRNQTDALTDAAVDFAVQQYGDLKPFQAFILVTESGYAPRMIGRHRHNLPIITLTRHEPLYRKLVLLWGVIPIYFPYTATEGESTDVKQIDEMLDKVRASNILHAGDPVILIYSSKWGQPGRNNVIRIEQL